MKNLKKPDSSTILTAAVYFTVICMFFACISSFYNQKTYYQLLLGYCDIALFAVIGILLYKGVYFSYKRYFSYLFLPFWFVVTFFLRGEFDLVYDVNRAHFLIICVCCGILLPLPSVLKDIDKRKVLDSVLIVVSLTMCVFLLLAYYGLVRGENLSLMNNKLIFGASYTYTHRMKLKIMNLHYYHTGFYSDVLFFCTLYLAFAHWNGWLKILWTFMLIVLASGVFITYSRTAVLSFVAGVLLTLYFCFFRKIKNKKLKWRICGLSAAGGVSVAIAAMNRIYIAVNSIRDVWYGITTLSSRTVIWSSLIPLVKDYPSVIFCGLPLNNAMDTVNLYLADLDYIVHMHNSYLQTFLHLGLGGLIAVTVFILYLFKCIRIILDNLLNADCQLCIVPIVIMLIGITESNFICNSYGYEMMNLLFALTSGYIIEKAISIQHRTDHYRASAENIPDSNHNIL